VDSNAKEGEQVRQPVGGLADLPCLGVQTKL